MRKMVVVIMLMILIKMGKTVMILDAVIRYMMKVVMWNNLLQDVQADLVHHLHGYISGLSSFSFVIMDYLLYLALMYLSFNF